MTLSPGVRRQMDTLLASQPETAPWLGVLFAVLEEAAEPTWDVIAASITLQAERSPGTPLLAGAHIPIDAPLAERWVRRVLALAAEAGPEGVGLRTTASDAEFESRAFLEAAVNADGGRHEAIARSLDVDPDALAAVAALAVMPLFQALRRRFGP